MVLTSCCVAGVVTTVTFVRRPLPDVGGTSRVAGLDADVEISRDELGVPNIIITLGPKGAYVHTDRVARLVPAPPVTAIDTTAAGDCFNGALAVALSEGVEIDQAVSFACKAASISVTRMGAQSSLPSRKEVNEISLLSSN